MQLRPRPITVGFILTTCLVAGCAGPGRRMTVEQRAAMWRVREELAKPVSLQMSDTTRVAVLDALGGLTKVSILVGPTGYSDAPIKEVNLDGVPLGQALRQVLERGGLDYAVTPEGVFVAGSRRAAEVRARGGLIDPPAPPPPEPIRVWRVTEETAAERRIRDILERRVSFDFDDKLFSSVITDLRTKYGLNVVEDRQAFAVVGITPRTVVTLHVKDIPFKSALNLILDQCGLDHVVRNSVLLLTDRRRADRALDVRIYDVSDLVPDGGVCNVCRSEWDDWDDGGDTPPCPLCGLSLFIQTVVAPESWMTTIDDSTTISPFAGHLLIIRQTPKVHERIAELLARLRDFERRQAASRGRRRGNRPGRKHVYQLGLTLREGVGVAQIHRQLRKPIAIGLSTVPFERAMRIFAKEAGVNVVLDRKALAARGIGPETTVTLRCRRLAAVLVLDLILDQVNLTYLYWHDVIYVTDAGACSRDREIRVYGVRDLVVPDDQPNGEPSRERAEELALLIQSVVAPESWSAGTTGASSIELFQNDILIVAQTPFVHDKIWDLLQTLCKALSRTNRPGGGLPGEEAGEAVAEDVVGGAGEAAFEEGGEDEEEGGGGGQGDRYGEPCAASAGGVGDAAGLEAAAPFRPQDEPREGVHGAEPGHEVDCRDAEGPRGKRLVPGPEPDGRGERIELKVEQHRRGRGDAGRQPHPPPEPRRRSLQFPRYPDAQVEHHHPAGHGYQGRRQAGHLEPIVHLAEIAQQDAAVLQRRAVQRRGAQQRRNQPAVVGPGVNQ